VDEFRATEKKLSVLVNNAGLLMNFKDTKRQYTKDNFELTMGTNHIGDHITDQHLSYLLTAIISFQFFCFGEIPPSVP